jgi:hypothetical protein
MRIPERRFGKLMMSLNQQTSQQNPMENLPSHNLSREST